MTPIQVKSRVNIFTKQGLLITGVVESSDESTTTLARLDYLENEGFSNTPEVFKDGTTFKFIRVTVATKDISVVGILERKVDGTFIAK